MVWVCDLVKVQIFVVEMIGVFGILVIVCVIVFEVVWDVDLIVIIMFVESLILYDVFLGVYIIVMGLDVGYKNEIVFVLLVCVYYVVDWLLQIWLMGELVYGLLCDEFFFELGQVLVGFVFGCLCFVQIILVDLIGIGIQDIVIVILVLICVLDVGVG